MVGRVRAIPNGVDCDRFRPDPTARDSVRDELGLGEGDPVALFVGGDWQRKGLTHAVDALAAAPDWHLLVAGSGDAAQLLARARAAGTQRRIRFLGAVRDTERLYVAADAFVLPTAYETFSLVTFEAAASGLPLLVTRVSGVEDLLEDERNGWFITADAMDIASRLNSLSADPQRAAAMGAAARADALAYSWESMAESYARAYSELLDREPARH
jgi:UDP-glucose:(heptosyl)LPS alpha-1,3-glucosyltransferase